jgi:leucyl-tRNA synthetase
MIIIFIKVFLLLFFFSGTDGEKMSKSRGNVINPDDVVQEFGADALRLYEMFMGPLEAVKPWQTDQLMGVVRFRDRVLLLASGPIINTTEFLEVSREMHKTIKKVTGDIERFSFNTVISSLMIYTNYLMSHRANSGSVPRLAVEVLVQMLSPFAPHVAEECWSLLGHKESLSLNPWPLFDESLCVDTLATVVIQVNGKVRGKVELDKDTLEEIVLASAMEQQNVVKYTQGNAIKKIIFIPGKILNILV